MDTVPLSYAAISFIVIIGCIGTCILSKCCTLRTVRTVRTVMPFYTRENTESSQTPPPYDNTATSSTINIQPPPYKFESSNNLCHTYDNIV